VFEFRAAVFEFPAVGTRRDRAPLTCGDTTAAAERVYAL